MSIVKHYIQTAARLTEEYTGSPPLHHFLREFFRSHKKYGSRDRKVISSLCYDFYRAGKLFPGFPREQQLVWSYFVCETTPGLVMPEADPFLAGQIQVALTEKLTLTGARDLAGTMLLVETSFSNGMNVVDYCRSMLHQPDIFLRIRRGNFSSVIEKLEELQWLFNLETANGVRLPAGLPVDRHFILDKEIVVQDLHSQEVGNLIHEQFQKREFQPKKMWDCCAASGGKSIMMHDVFDGLQITVCDIRESIIANLKKRFSIAGINNYRAFVTDLSTGKQLPVKPNPFIIADVPCTGSGTWSRTPEQLYFFNASSVNRYAEKQYAIAKNASQFLLPGGYLAYITCSVFKEENEGVIDKLIRDTSLKPVFSKMLDGTRLKADSMFLAILQAA